MPRTKIALIALTFVLPKNMAAATNQWPEVYSHTTRQVIAIEQISDGYHITVTMRHIGTRGTVLQQWDEIWWIAYNGYQPSTGYINIVSWPKYWVDKWGAHHAPGVYNIYNRHGDIIDSRHFYIVPVAFQQIIQNANKNKR